MAEYGGLLRSGGQGGHGTTHEVRGVDLQHSGCLGVADGPRSHPSNDPADNGKAAHDGLLVLVLGWLVLRGLWWVGRVDRGGEWGWGGLGHWGVVVVVMMVQHVVAVAVARARWGVRAAAVGGGVGGRVGDLVHSGAGQQGGLVLGRRGHVVVHHGLAADRALERQLSGRRRKGGGSGQGG